MSNLQRYEKIFFENYEEINSTHKSQLDKELDGLSISDKRKILIKTIKDIYSKKNYNIKHHTKDNLEKIKDLYTRINIVKKYVLFTKLGKPF